MYSSDYQISGHVNRKKNTALISPKVNLENIIYTMCEKIVGIQRNTFLHQLESARAVSGTSFNAPNAFSLIALRIYIGEKKTVQRKLNFLNTSVRRDLLCFWCCCCSGNQYKCAVWHKKHVSLGAQVCEDGHTGETNRNQPFLPMTHKKRQPVIRLQLFVGQATHPDCWETNSAVGKSPDPKKTAFQKILE